MLFYFIIGPITVESSQGIINQNVTTPLPSAVHPTTFIPTSEIPKPTSIYSEEQSSISNPVISNSSSISPHPTGIVTPTLNITTPTPKSTPTPSSHLTTPTPKSTPSPSSNITNSSPNTSPTQFIITTLTVPPSSSQSSSTPPSSSSTLTVSQTNRSHYNHTSQWESFIHHYRISPITESSTLLLFVVNFHEPHYEETSFILNQYFVEFRKRFMIDYDVILVGPWEDKKKTVKGTHLPLYGHYSYYSLAYVYYHLCVVESCSYYGFFYMNDDSYIDPRFLSKYDLTKSWSEPSTVYRTNCRWMWNKKNNIKNVPYKQAFYDAVKELKALPIAKNCHLENARNLRRGFADAFYLILSDMPKWYEMIMIMKNHYVFLEVAAPTVNWCITRNAINDCNHGKMKNRRKCVHVHPVKYRMPNMKEYCLKRLDHLNLDTAPPRMY